MCIGHQTHETTIVCVEQKAIKDRSKTGYFFVKRFFAGKIRIRVVCPVDRNSGEKICMDNNLILWKFNFVFSVSFCQYKLYKYFLDNRGGTIEYKRLFGDYTCLRKVSQSESLCGQSVNFL